MARIWYNIAEPEYLRCGKRHMHIEHNRHFESCVFNELGQHHEMVVVHPYHVIGASESNQTLTHRL